ncbi:MAG: regulatory protein LuxR [Nocardioidaceae bacterium]|nr:regulatory protein LuxR [Nocardioidaceae bacterium]
MTTQRAIEVDLPWQSDGRQISVSVVDATTVEVQGLSPQQMIDLLHATGAAVVVDGTAPRGAARATDVELTDREVEILRSIATGMANHEVADRMFLSINTVKTYIRSAYRKTGITSRTHAVLWAIDHGLVPAHPDEVR